MQKNKAKLEPKDMTVEYVHFCLDCDDNPVDEYETDHGIQVDAKLVNDLVENYGLKATVAKDMIQHYLQGDVAAWESDVGRKFSIEFVYIEFFGHAEMHYKSGDFDVHTQKAAK